MPTSLPSFTDFTGLLCFAFILLVPFALVGIALINTGLGRSRSAAHMMMCSLGVIAVAALAYFAVGFSWQGYLDSQGFFFTIGGKQWNWIAAERLFLRSVPMNGSPASLAAWLEMLSVALAAMIPLGAGADRWRMSAVCLSTSVLSGFTFPLFAHWVWGGGWLEQLGANYGVGAGFVDAGGAATIQCVGGLSALSIAWILGPRLGKYSREGVPLAIPGHNAVLMMVGCVLALIGWIGLNGASAILMAGADPGSAVLIAANTLISAASAGLAAAIVTKIRFRKPDASLSVNGWVGGLVASSAACAFVQPPEAVVIGAIAGGLVTLSVEWFELRIGVDDPGGAISSHLLAGVWGLIAAGLLAHVGDANGASHEQLVAQLVGIATLLGFVFPVCYGVNWVIDRLHPQRARAEGERYGMDLYELGAGAYPEFVTHNDEGIDRRM